MPVSGIDKALVRQRFNRGALTYGEHAVVQSRTARALTDALVDTLAQTCFPRVFEPGCGDGTLTRLLLSRLAVESLTVNDIAEAFRAPIDRLAAQYPQVTLQFCPGDVEHIRLPDQLDLVAANAVLQWLDDLDAFFEHVRAALNPGGILAFSTFGEHNLPEVTAITGQSLGYVSCADHRARLARDFEILASWESRETMVLPSGLDVLRHLKATGVNALAAPHWTRGDLADFEAQYQARYATASGVTLTFQPIYFIVKAREPNDAS